MEYINIYEVTDLPQVIKKKKHGKCAMMDLLQTLSLEGLCLCYLW